MTFRLILVWATAVFVAIFRLTTHPPSPDPPACFSFVFQVACREIKLEGFDPAKASAMEDQLLDNAFQLAINCLSYDFIGTNPA